MKLRFLSITIPQGSEGNKKLESKFQELLVNLRNTFTGKTVSLEYFGFDQYTYFFMAVEANLFETVEGLVYATFPDAEISETGDYTAHFDAKKQALAGATIELSRSDIYPIKTYDLFEEDSSSRLFSVNSKISGNEQVWVQIIAEPCDDTALFHFKRRILLRDTLKPLVPGFLGNAHVRG